MFLIVNMERFISVSLVHVSPDTVHMPTKQRFNTQAMFLLYILPKKVCLNKSCLYFKDLSFQDLTPSC